MTPFLLFLLLACSSTDPTLAAQHDAVVAWEAGVAALARGEAEEAQAQFERARRARPDDGLLFAWEGQAAAAAGDLELAVERTEHALKMAPNLAEARYNRAAYLARLGRLDEAGPELQRALVDGARSPRDTVEDPDFASHLEHTAFAFLPRSALEIEVQAPSGPLFLGSQLSVTLTVGGATGPIDLSAPGSGPAVMVSVVEDVRDDVRKITWTMKVTGAGQVAIGPLKAVSGTREASAATVVVETQAPPDRAAVEPTELALTTPSAIGAELELPGASAARDQLMVKALPGDRVELDPGGGQEVRWELREEGQARWVVHGYTGLAPSTHQVQLRRQGRPVWKTSVEVPGG